MMTMEELNLLWERVAPRLEPSFGPLKTEVSSKTAGEGRALQKEKSPRIGLEMVIVFLQLIILSNCCR